MPPEANSQWKQKNSQKNGKFK